MAAAPSETVMTELPSSRPPSGSRSRSSSWSGAGSAVTLRKVGAEIAHASIDRFGRVDRARFEVLDELARGGLGRVFRARDPRTGRIIAIKEVLHPTPEIVARFAREALVTANLQHPSIVPVYEVGTWGDGEPFYAMKLVAGRTLDRVIAGAATIDERVALVPHVIAIADALAYAHSEHVIHRDLKPSNVIVGAYGETVVIDWGLAKNLAIDEPEEDVAESPTLPPDNQETVAGSVLGTPAYMPPEQARGERLDEHADVYAIGAILYHLLTGKRPFAEVTDLAELIECVARRAPTPIVELAPAAPAELVAIADKAMARDASARYPTAEGLAGDLRRYQAGKLVGAHHYTRLQLVRRWIARYAAAVTVGVAAVLVLAVSGVFAVRRIANERDEARRQGAIARARGDEAEAANAAAKHRLADTLEELGRQALVTTQPDRALPLLAASAEMRDAASPTLELLAAQARAAYTGLVAIAPAPSGVASTGGLAEDGNTILVASGDDGVMAWDIAARRTRWTVAAGSWIAIAPDGARFLASAADGTLTLRSVEDARALDTWAPGAHGRPGGLTWAPDGARFAFATDQRYVAIGTPGQPALVGVALAAGVNALAFSPDGTRLAIADDRGAILLVDARSGAIVARLAEAATSLAAITWLDDDLLVDGDDRGTVRLWHAGERRVRRRFELGRSIYVLALARDGDWLAAAGDGGGVRVWTVATGELRAELADHHLGVDFATAVGDVLVTGDELGVVRVWNPHDGELLHVFSSEDELVAFDVRDGAFAAIALGRQRVWRFTPDAVVRRVAAHTARIRGLAFGPDGTVYTASLDGTGAAIDVARGTVQRLGAASGFVEAPSRTLAQLELNTRVNPHGVRSLGVSPDGRTVALAFEDGRLELFDRTGAHVASWRGHTGRVRRVIFAPDGKTAYSVGDTTLRAWDVATGAERGRATLAGTGWDVAIVNADTLATFSERPSIVQLWHAADLVERRTLPLATDLTTLAVAGGHLLVSDVQSIALLDDDGAVLRRAPQVRAFSTDTNDAGSIAIGATNGRIVLYDRVTLAPVRDFQFGSHVITSVAFRPDGKVLAAISESRVALFDPATGLLLATLPDLPVMLAHVAWSPDGNHLAIAGAGGTVWIWDVTPADARALRAYGDCVSSWRLDDTTLVKKPFEPERCAILAR